ncbi:MAG: TetR/AcrR family transcriptional regulator [Planctomycetota bacterium]
MGKTSSVGGRSGRPKDPELVAKRNEQLLAHAVELFARDGYSGTDVQELAEMAGVGKGTVYRYFPTKEDLFLGAVDWGMRRLSDGLNALIVDDSDPMDRLKSAIRAYLCFFNQHPEIVELFMIERAVFKDRKRPTYFKHREENIGPWESMLGQLVRKKRIRDVPLSRITNVISDLLYGTLFTNHFGGRRKDLEEQANDIIDVIFKGIEAEHGR